MNETLLFKPFLGAVLAALAIAAAALVVLSDSSGAGDAPGPEILGVANACVEASPLREESARVVFGKSPDGKPEVTEWSVDGAYHVTRCNEAGELVVRQHVVPVKTPDGPKMLVTETTTPSESLSGLLPADFTETPDGIAVWREEGEQMLGQTLPPTSEPEKTTGSE